MACPPLTLPRFSLITQSSSAILRILMCDFLFQLTSSFEVQGSSLFPTIQVDTL